MNQYEVQICYTPKINRMIVKLYLQTHCRCPKCHHVLFQMTCLETSGWHLQTPSKTDSFPDAFSDPKAILFYFGSLYLNRSYSFCWYNQHQLAEKHHPHHQAKNQPLFLKINICWFYGHSDIGKKNSPTPSGMPNQRTQPTQKSDQTMAAQQIIRIHWYLTEEKIPEKPLRDGWWFRNPKQPTTWDVENPSYIMT